MKRKLLASTLSIVALALGTAFSQVSTAHAIGFTPPQDNSAPRESSGGASRGSFFIPADENSAPRGSSGGASRGGFFVPADDNSAPRDSSGGASRGGFFVPPGDNSTPNGSSGGASRGGFFVPPGDNVAPAGTTGGASRGGFFAPPTDNSAPDSSAGGASRGSTYEINSFSSASSLSNTTMMAMIPESFFGTTLESRPTIMVYVPASAADEAVFSLKDEFRNTIYQTTVSVPQQGGVILVELPADAPELTVGQDYQWYLAMLTDQELSPASPFVDGWIQRIEASDELASSLQSADDLTRVAALGSAGIWYDTAAQLAQMQASQPDETMTGHWVELLESVGLESVASAPLML